MSLYVANFIYVMCLRLKQVISKRTQFEILLSLVPVTTLEYDISTTMNLLFSSIRL